MDVGIYLFITNIESVVTLVPRKTVSGPMVERSAIVPSSYILLNEFIRYLTCFSYDQDEPNK